MKILTLEQRFNRMPPVVCFVIARKKSTGNQVEALEAEEIAQRSGLSVDRVNALSWLCSWDTVPVGEMLAFTKACGIDLSSYDNMHIHYKFYKRRRGRFPHLLRRCDYPLYRGRIELYKNYLKAHTKR